MVKVGRQRDIIKQLQSENIKISYLKNFMKKQNKGHYFKEMIVSWAVTYILQNQLLDLSDEAVGDHDGFPSK